MADLQRLKSYFEELVTATSSNHQKNSGPSYTRNVGLANSTGDWVCFCDSDDSLQPDYLSVLVSGIPACFSVANFYGEGHMDYESEYRGELTADVIGFLFDKNLIWTPWAKLFKRSILLEYDIRYDDKMIYGEDSVFCWEYLSHCKDIAILPSVIYDYFGPWGGETKHPFTEEEYDHYFGKMWGTIHTLCKRFSIKTSVGTVLAKKSLLAAIGQGYNKK